MARGGRRKRETDEADPSTRTLKLLSINVTNATKAKAIAILEHPEAQDADAIALQEIRLDVIKPAWLIGLTQKMGWGVACSSPPPRNTVGTTRQGGTAILWKRSLGRVTIARGPCHRSIAAKFANVCFFSIYGHAQKYDAKWCDDFVDWQRVVAAGVPSVMIGDWNWKPQYMRHFNDSANLAEANKATTSADSKPTRCVVEFGSATELSASPVEGIKQHYLVAYSVDLKVPTRQLTRLRKTALYEWTNHACGIDETAEIMFRATPLAPASAPLRERWESWHERAESIAAEAATRGVATQVRKAERPKGSEATSRNVNDTAQHRLDELVSLRRARRLHRRYAQRLKDRQKHKNKDDTMNANDNASLRRRASIKFWNPVKGCLPTPMRWTSRVGPFKSSNRRRPKTLRGDGGRKSAHGLAKFGNQQKQ